MQVAHHRPARADGFVFYSVAISTLLQGAAPVHVRNLSALFGEDEDVRVWLYQVWLQEETQHSQMLQTYVGQVWPEFNLKDSFSRYLFALRDRMGQPREQRPPGLEALACCLMEAEAALMFRVLSVYTPDPELKRLMLQISATKLRHYNFYRETMERLEQQSPSPALHKALTVLRCQRDVEDGNLALAFRPLNAHWGRNVPFGMMDYGLFLAHAGKVMGQYYPFEEVRRLLVAPLRRHGPLSALFVGLALRYVERLYVARGRLAPATAL
ncbi:MAG: ferritin-like domain-containing protein [Betaproteobacteria bacterium]|nr:ferritin-like domain-containing protein [Betaproteobacteria bacterium]